MTEKKRGAVETIPDIEVRASEIPVARNRSVEPYIKTFTFSPENVTQESLGMLVGAFSVSDRSESSEYVVNLIASVVKKEYYINPNRGVVESFESTLHRINLALSELVKNGKTSWMGDLHGAIAVIEKEDIHFSATGDAKILLFRNGSLADIGDGLASEEAASHPLKTFLEISSGRLVPDDCILLATPEPLELFSPKELERNANRLLPEGKFVRFLETAMINELRAGAAVVLDARKSDRTKEAARSEKPKRKRVAKIETVNVWSEKAFQEAAKERAKGILESYDPEEDIAVPEPADIAAPPPHEIRIQGEVPGNADEHPMITRIRWMLEDTKSSFRNGVSRSIRNTRRRSAEAIDSVSMAVADVAESAKSARFRPKGNPMDEAAETTEPQGTFSFPEKRPTGNPSPVRHTGTTLGHAVPADTAMPSDPRSGETDPHDDPHGNREGAAGTPDGIPREMPAIRPTADPKTAPDRERPDMVGTIATTLSIAGKTSGLFLSERAMPAMRTSCRLFRRVAISVTRKITTSCIATWRRFLALPPKRQLLTAAGLAFLLTGIGAVVWKNTPEKNEEPAPVVVMKTPTDDPLPPAGEKNATLAVVAPLPKTDQDIIAPIYLGNSLYLVTKTGVLDIQKSLSYAMPLPGKIRLTAGMKDLGLIFLLTEQGELYSFAPANRALVKNAITLPSGFRAASIGNYSTYLYFLEEGTGKVYRFPRADGGFGDGVLWTKSAMPSDTRSIAVSENVYGAGASVPTAFSRGIPVGGFSPERPATTFTVTAICANADLSDRVVALDAPAKRIIVLDGKGTLLSQSFNGSLVSATSCAINQDGTAVAVSGGTDSYAIAIPR